MSDYTDRANKRIEAALHSGMDAGEVDEIVNRIYQQESEQEEQAPSPALFPVGSTVQFTRRFGYGLDWINLGHRYGRVEGVHWYGQWVYDLQKLAPR